jgi:hypothetical protein
VAFPHRLAQRSIAQLWHRQNAAVTRPLAALAQDKRLIGERRIVSEGVVIGCRWWHPKPSAKVNEQSGQAARKVMTFELPCSTEPAGDWAGRWHIICRR